MTTVIIWLDSSSLVYTFELCILELCISDSYIQRPPWHLCLNTSLNIQASGEVLKIPRLHLAETPKSQKRHLAFNSGSFQMLQAKVVTFVMAEMSKAKAIPVGISIVWHVTGNLFPFNFTENFFNKLDYYCDRCHYRSLMCHILFCERRLLP